MPNTHDLDAAVLGSILLLQSALEAAVDDQRLSEILCHGLERVPGVAKCSVELGATAVESDAPGRAAFDYGTDHTRRFALHTAFQAFGWIELGIASPAAFAPYMPFVSNTANLAAMRLENRHQARALAQLNQTLEDQVAERTQELERERANLTALVNNTDASIWSIDRDYCLLVANAVFQSHYIRAIGRPVAHGESIHVEGIPADWVSEWQAHFERAFAGESFGILTQLHAAPLVEMRYHFSPIRDEQGQVVGATAHGRDVTQERAAERRLREQERFVSALVDTSPVLIYVYDLDENKNAYVNSGIERLLGYTSEHVQALGSDLFSELIHPDDLPRVHAAQATLRDADDDAIVQLIYRVRHADGSWRIHRSYERPFRRDGVGQVSRKIGVAIDVTDQVRAESDLRDSEARFRAIYEHQAVGLARVSLDNRLLGANKAYCDMLGYTESELIGKHLSYITVPELQEENLALQANLSLGKVDHYRMEKRFRHKEGHTVIGILDANLVRDAHGEPAYALGSVVDITERVRAMRELEERNEELSRFNRVAVGRELRMIELKQEINTLRGQMGLEPAYIIDSGGE